MAVAKMNTDEGYKSDKDNSSEEGEVVGAVGAEGGGVAPSFPKLELDLKGKDQDINPSCPSTSSKRGKGLVVKFRIPDGMSRGPNTGTGGNESRQNKKRRNQRRKHARRSRAQHNQWWQERSDRYFPFEVDFKSYPRLNLECPAGQVSILEYNLKIRPLPLSYNVQNRCKYFNTEPPPFLSQEEENEMLLRDLRGMRYFESAPIGNREWKISKVQCYGITAKGTILIRFVDEKNLAHFSNLIRRITYCTGMHKLRGLDARIRKEDVEIGLLVLAHIKKDKKWIRGRIESFSKNWIVVSGVDELIFNLKLRYDDVFYIHRDLYHCPFQIQECYLSGLEKWEETSLIRFIWYRLEQVVLREDFVDDSDEDEDDDDGVSRFPDDFWITSSFRRKEKHYIKLNFPDEFNKNVEVNGWIKQQLVNFDPFKELLVTP